MPLRAPSVLTLTFLLVLSGALEAQEPEDFRHAAGEVLRALEAGEEEVLRRWTDRIGPPDPWMVAEYVRTRAGKEAALSFARTGTREEVRALVAWLEATDEPPVPQELWDAWQKAAAMWAMGGVEPALVLLDVEAEGGSTPWRLTTAFLRAKALQTVGRYDEALQVFAGVPDRCRELGWLASASAGYEILHQIRLARNDLDEALAAARASVDVERRRKHPEGIVRALGQMASVLIRRRDFAGAMECLADAEAFYRQRNDRRGLLTVTLQRSQVLLEQGLLKDALELLQPARAAAEEIGDPELLQALHSALGTALHRTGSRGPAREQFRKVLEYAGARGDEVAMLRAWIYLGVSWAEVGQHRRAREPLRQALDLALKRGERWLAVYALGNLGVAEEGLGNHGRAVELQERSLALATEIGDRAGRMRALVNLGCVNEVRGELEAALRRLTEALDLAREVRDLTTEAQVLGALAQVYVQLGETARAAEMFGQAIGIQERQGDRPGLRRSLGLLAETLPMLGRHEEALVAGERSLALAEALGDPREVAAALVSLAGIYEEYGRIGEALSYFERTLAIQRAQEDLSPLSKTLVNYALTLEKIGRLEEARAAYEEAVELCAHSGNRDDLLGAFLNLAHLYRELGLEEERAAAAERAAAIAEEIGSPLGRAAARGLLARRHYDAGDFEKALQLYEQQLEDWRAIEDLRNIARIHVSIGACRSKLGDQAGARDAYARSVEIAAELGAADLEVKARNGLARALFGLGDHAAALEAARRGADAVDRVAGRLADEEAAGARELGRGVFGEAVRAALALGDLDAVVEFVERSRAASILEDFGGRSVLEGRVLEPELAELSRRARTEENLAWSRLRDARRAGDRKEVQRCAVSLEAARERRRQVAERIRREARAEASFAESRVARREEIQAALREHEALVSYLFLADSGLAVVITSEGTRPVRLADLDAVYAAARKIDVRSADPELVAGLRALLLDPLDLPDRIGRLVVSPSARLSEIPFALLAPELEIALTPSGTVLRLLRQREAGPRVGVLAVGDPDYAAEGESPAAEPVRSAIGPLAPLPGSGVEARAVGTEVLLGPDATEDALLDRLASRDGWRAVHLACHGLVDVEHPMLSALALAPAPGSDGLLTALEILEHRFAADLVTLSACETGRGRVYSGEGLLGLTRAFLLSGAPRVLCSLWKVDDEATRALMVKFYELWDPKEGQGLPAATALRKAQEFVKSHEKWKHPYYWAAWVLWGLPE